MGNSFAFEWEVSFMEWLQGLDNPVFTAIARFFTLFGEELVLVGIIGFIYWCFDKNTGKFIATNFLPTLLAGPLIKNIVMRRRPYMDHAGIKCLKQVDTSGDLYDINVQGYSFPSMHASNTLSVYGSLAISQKNTGFKIATAAVLFLIGLSRVYVGVHYPTDVLVGWVLGIVVVSLMTVLQKKIKNHLVFAAIFGLIGLPGWFYCTSTDFYTAYGILVGIFIAFSFEEKKVNFENTKSIPRCILRVAGGVGIFLGLNTALKLPFPSEILEAEDFVSHLIRALRYAIVSFSVMALYPMVFKYTAKLGSKKQK